MELGLVGLAVWAFCMFLLLAIASSLCLRSCTRMPNAWFKDLPFTPVFKLRTVFVLMVFVRLFFLLETGRDLLRRRLIFV